MCDNTTKLSLVIPCFNEEKNVEEFYKTVKKSFAEFGVSYECVFVDDGSKDNTFEKLKEIFYKNLNDKNQIIRFSRNFGKESAMYAGLKCAKGEYICIIDADLQQSPEVVKKMVEILEKENVDCVAAFQTERHESKALVFFKKMFYSIINKTSDIEFVAGASDFRTFKKSVANAILQMEEKYRFSKGIFSWVGFDTKYIEYEALERFAGTSKWSFRKLFRYALDGIISFTTTPLKIATFLGSCISVCSLIYFIWILIQKLCFGIVIPGYPTLVCLILLLGGMQLVMLGIIGEYLGRVYIEGKNRPIYIAKEVLTYDDFSNKEQG